MSEVTMLLERIKEDLRRKDETYRLIADSKPKEDCKCISCMVQRINEIQEGTKK